MSFSYSHLDVEDCMELPLPQQNTTNFFYSFSLLPKEEREAIHTVYAFCRYTDDIVDDDDIGSLARAGGVPAQSLAHSVSKNLHRRSSLGGAQTNVAPETSRREALTNDMTESLESEKTRRKRARLDKWRAEVARCYSGSSTHPVLLPLSAVVKRFSIPEQYLQTLIDGCERDLMQRRYKSFDELKEYCYSVASIVGLICIEIFGYKYDETKEYAVNLGYALQLTNILRDIRHDAEKGRIYLPQEDLERFHYTEEELFGNVYNDNFVQLMQFEARRAREYYHKGRAALRPDESITMFAAQIMDAIYYRLLEKIEIADYNVFHRKISVSTSHKALIALRLWTKSRLLLKKSSRQ